MIAQDTGSAIVGPARADVYFGAGDQAGEVARRLHNPGDFVMLVPREINPAVAGAHMPLPPEKPPVLLLASARTSSTKSITVPPHLAHLRSPLPRCSACNCWVSIGSPYEADECRSALALAVKGAAQFQVSQNTRASAESRDSVARPTKQKQVRN
jgi:hypothetical protein